MAEITAQLVKELRDKTNAGMMDCKAALSEAGGDLEAAETILRKKGIAAADKKASRATSEGVIASQIDDEAKVGVLVEVDCETDFVAKNENFQAFVQQIVGHVATADKAESADALLDQPYIEGGTVGDLVKAKIGELGENMAVPRCTRYALGEEGGDAGVVASYIHLQGKVGVLTEVNCASDGVAQDDSFRELVKDITLHIAAAQPICITREEVPSDLVEKEKEIFREQMKDKPAEIIDKIVGGKIDKYYSTVCLLEQGFIKDPDQTVGDLLAAKSKDLGEELVVRRFVRYAVGEGV